MSDRIQVGGLYLSNNPTFPGQIFRVTQIGAWETRYSRPNRIIGYQRWALRADGSWYLVENTRSWETSLGESEFGEPVPEVYHSEIAQTD